MLCKDSTKSLSAMLYFATVLFYKSMSHEKILLLGAGGQIGVELTAALREKHGDENVLPTDLKPTHDLLEKVGRYAQLDAMDKNGIGELIKKEGFTQVYHLAAVLSATGEKNPKLAWDVNMESLMGLLELGRELKLSKIFWPSSIAVFGPSSPKHQTSQSTIIEPSSMYGITKNAGENLCAYYNDKYDMDIRSIRYPGLISYKSPPGGGTTDYAIDIFYKALAGERYSCFLKKDAFLPMMFMDDAIRATLELMEADKKDLSIKRGYNVTALSFSPEEIAAEIKRRIPEFTIEYKPDYRQDIANDWPASIDDSTARTDWGWQEKFDLPSLVDAMISGIKGMQNVGS
jgi:nucleoside-diphosphate-sugar epimerase